MAKLRRSQRNELFEVIRESGLDPADFMWDFVMLGHDCPAVPSLRHRSSQFFFTFEEYEDGMYSPGCSRMGDVLAPVRWNTWVQQFRCWLEELKGETQEPDLWEQLSQSQIGLDFSADSEADNRPFTGAEAKQITAGIKKMQEYLATECPEVAGFGDEINEKLGYLTKAVGRLGRIDWANACIGALVGVGFDRLLTHDHGRRLMEILKWTVDGIVRLLN